MQIPRPIIPTPTHVDMHVRHRVLLPSFVHLPSVSQPWPGGKDQEIRNNLITTTSRPLPACRLGHENVSRSEKRGPVLPAFSPSS